MNNPQRHRAISSTLAAAVTLVGVLALTGCAPPTPTVMKTPDIIWPDGKPNSTLESDAWVIAARKAAIGLSLAANTADYSIAQLTEVVTDDIAADLYDDRLRAVKNGAPETMWVGPDAWEPLGVEVADSGNSAVISVCRARDWYIDAEQPTPSLDRGRPGTIEMIKEADGVIRYAGNGTVLAGRTCDPAVIRAGLYDPAPELSHSRTVDQVRGPIEAER